MARRKSYQKGSIEWKNGKPTLKYELRVGDKWLTKRESMPEWVDTQKQANQHRDQRMMEINQINNAIQRPVVGDAPPITLESLVKGRWAQYISERELKPSTVYSYDLVLRTHILPELGSRELKEASTCSGVRPAADIYVHGRREAKAGKAIELLASQIVPVFSEEQELVSEMVQ